MKSIGKYIGIIAVAAASILYGFEHVLSKWLVVQNVNEMEMTCIRFLIGAAVCFAVCLIKKLSLKISKKQIRDLIIFGVFSYGLTCYILAVAKRYIDVGLATMLHFLYPAVTVIFVRIFFKEYVSKRRWISVCFAILGIALMLIKSGDSSASVFGIVLALCSSVTYMLYIVSNERSSIHDINYMVTVFYISLFNAVFFLIIRLLSGEWVGESLNIVTITSIGVQSVFFTVIPIYMLTFGLSRTGATQGAVVNLIEPVVALVGGMIIFKEKLTLPALIGCAFLLFSVLLITTSKKEDARK